MEFGNEKGSCTSQQDEPRNFNRRINIRGEFLYVSGMTFRSQVLPSKTEHHSQTFLLASRLTGLSIVPYRWKYKVISALYRLEIPAHGKIMAKIMRSGRIVVVPSQHIVCRQSVIVRPTKAIRRCSHRWCGTLSTSSTTIHLMPIRYNVHIKFDKEFINKQILKDPMKKKKKAGQLVPNDF
ncbi:unnamed protein product [Lepeophtheirus salmonis]|uniref:(salmon louse) hypothetical protein n=1 Tax=Lepeophtheirus salmonis TaxID=72036 RepID=A0A7R8H181_LEPSM|nr:unnamed protein product [Lepeophtheirus salmonis]CAF2804451.1 unnamed protein product [Lepeophtheirus salmonis]